MIVTPHMAEAMYLCLRSMRPFCKWGLPDADSVGFRINGAKGDMGAHNFHTGCHHIYLSQVNVRHFDALATTMAHEMIHVKQLMSGKERTHGKYFLECAKQVCDELGWHMRDVR